MVAKWQDVVSQQAEQIASRLRELLSSGLVLLHSELGVDLGLKPDLYPAWVVLLTACIGLLLLVVLWASACRGIFKRRSTSNVTVVEETPETTKPPLKTVKPEEQKKKNKKKPVEKKPQPNGRAVTELPEEVKEPEENLTQHSQDVKTEKAKKSKKKAKPVVKETKSTPTDGKEPDDGAWETKVSSREKRRQQKKDKPTGDGSASPGGLEPPSSVSATEQPKAKVAAPTVQRKSKGEPLRAKAEKGDAVVTQVTPRLEEVPAVNGSGWNDLGLKLPPQMPSTDGENWAAITKTTGKDSQEPPVWGQEMEGSWVTVAPRALPADLNPVSFTGPGISAAAGESQAVPDLCWTNEPPVEDEWSGLNGTSANPSSDWNAPAEVWGNYEEPHPESPDPQEELVVEEVQVCQQGSEDEQEKSDPPAAAGSGKPKKKKKKRKKVEDAEAAPPEEPERDAPAEAVVSSQPVQAAAPAASAPVEAPVEVLESVPLKTPTRVPPTPAEPQATAKQNSTAAPSQNKSAENWESPKQVKKKKARRET